MCFLISECLFSVVRRFFFYLTQLILVHCFQYLALALQMRETQIERQIPAWLGRHLKRVTATQMVVREQADVWGKTQAGCHCKDTVMVETLCISAVKRTRKQVKNSCIPSTWVKIPYKHVDPNENVVWSRVLEILGFLSKLARCLVSSLCCFFLFLCSHRGEKRICFLSSFPHYFHWPFKSSVIPPFCLCNCPLNNLYRYGFPLVFYFWDPK